MNDWINTRIGQEMANAVIRISRSFSKKIVQATETCRLIYAGDVIESHLKNGERYVNHIPLDEEWVTIIFEKEEQR